MHPATEKDLKKYSIRESIMVEETGYVYQNVTKYAFSPIFELSHAQQSAFHSFITHCGSLSISCSVAPNHSSSSLTLLNLLLNKASFVRIFTTVAQQIIYLTHYQSLILTFIMVTVTYSFCFF